MTLDVCWFVARGQSEADLSGLRERAYRLAQFLGGSRDVLSVVTLPELRVLVGAVGLRGNAVDVSEGCVWGSLFPLGLTGLRAADDATLRRWVGPGAAATWSSREARLLTAPSEVTALYEADDRAWSTHAVAAAYLAHGRVRVRPGAVAEILAFGHVSGTGSLAEGVSAVPPASQITLRLGATDRGTWWRRDDRWRLVEDSAAHTAAGRALEESVAERSREGAVFLGLSAGLDSRVAAVALRRAGVDFIAYTWGADGAADVAGARAVAEALGVAHRVVRADWLDDETALASSIRDSLVTDGGYAFGFGAPSDVLPDDMVNVSGMGGELGRAFYYRQLARLRAEPTAGQLRRLWRPERLLPDGVADEARMAVAQAADAAVTAAVALPGVTGWRALDVVYAELQMRYWGRARIRPSSGIFVPVFLTPQVAAALVSQSLDERLRDGFHRWYLATYGGQALCRLPLPPVVRQRRGVPPPLRRTAAWLRAVRPTWPPRTLSELPRVRTGTFAYLTDIVARSPLVEEGLGEAFGRRLRGDLARHDDRAVNLALRLAPAVTLEEHARSGLT